MTRCTFKRTSWTRGMGCTRVVRANQSCEEDATTVCVRHSADDNDHWCGHARCKKHGPKKAKKG